MKIGDKFTRIGPPDETHLYIEEIYIVTNSITAADIYGAAAGNEVLMVFDQHNQVHQIHEIKTDEMKRNYKYWIKFLPKDLRDKFKKEINGPGWRKDNQISEFTSLARCIDQCLNWDKCIDPHWANINYQASKGVYNTMYEDEDDKIYKIKENLLKQMGLSEENMTVENQISFYKAFNDLLCKTISDVAKECAESLSAMHDIIDKEIDLSECGQENWHALKESRSNLKKIKEYEEDAMKLLE